MVFNIKYINICIMFLIHVSQSTVRTFRAYSLFIQHIIEGQSFHRDSEIDDKKTVFMLQWYPIILNIQVEQQQIYIYISSSWYLFEKRRLQSNGIGTYQNLHLEVINNINSIIPQLIVTGSNSSVTCINNFISSTIQVFVQNRKYHVKD